ncbi:ATP-binding protein [Gracilimonas sediminicola]|uniref:ATP-binding protein n=1 Tax=Gracilimonas sediminicola TaxID=2952158 RepID=UPI0038D4ED76
MGVTASELSKMEFDTYKLSHPWDKIVGKPEVNGSILLYSPAGSGKSTVAMQLCDEFTNHGNVLYVAAEEGISATLKDKVNRSNLQKSEIDFHEWEGEEKLKKYILKNDINILCIDSYTIIDERLSTFEPFRLWCREHDVFFITIVQQTKDGKFYGKASAGFNVDCKIQVIDGRPSTEATGKNRFGPLYTHDEDLTQNPATKPKKSRKKKSTKKKKSTSGPKDFDASMSEVEQMMKNI